MATKAKVRGSGGKGRTAGFGAVETLPSGRFRVRWRDTAGIRHTAEQTFPTVTAARAFLATIQADMLRKTYRAPRAVTETLSEYAAEWLEGRPGLKASTRNQYRIDFRLHIEPYLGKRRLDRIEPEHVRKWHADLTTRLKRELAPVQPLNGRTPARRTAGTATVARSYRLLRAILQTAVDDERLVRQPCRIAGAGEARSTERPVLSGAEIAQLAQRVPGHYRAFVILAAYSGLRAGELAALRVSDLDLGSSPVVRVHRRFYRVAGEMTVDLPKSAAGFRVVPIPVFVAAELKAHLETHRSTASADDLVFVTASGRDVTDGYSQVLRRALNRLGRADVRTHDLRHSALTVAAEHGASLATLMHMAGHSTPAAALRYQHATAEHARQVAQAIHDAAAAHHA